MSQLSLFEANEGKRLAWLYCSHCHSLNFTTENKLFICDNCDHESYPLHECPDYNPNDYEEE